MEPSSDQWCVTNVADAASTECDPVRLWLREFNVAASPLFMGKIEQPGSQATPLNLLATVNSRTVGGLIAETKFAWLRISIMSVSPEWRLKRIGAALVAEAEQQAIVRGCRYAYVDTMDYQAPRFYAKQGFRVVGEISDWDSHGHTKLFLTKELPSPENDAT